MGILQTIKNFLRIDDKKKVYMPLDEETIKRDETIKAMAQEISSKNIQLANYVAKDKEKKDKEKLKDKESEFNKKLNEQKLDLDAHKHGKIIKLGKFYKHFFKDEKFRNKLEICDKNDEVILGKFGDFGIMEGGKLCVLDNEGNLMSYGKSLHHILYKPDSFENQSRRGRFLIPMDKDGNWMEDIEYKEIPEPLEAEFDEETGDLVRIEWSKVKTSEVKKVIARFMEQIHGLSSEIERTENVIIKQKDKIDDLNRTIKIYENQSNISQSHLSKALFKTNEIEKRFSDIHSQNTKLLEIKSTYDSIITKYESVFQSIVQKLDAFSEPKYNMIKSTLKEDLQFFKAILPDTVNIKEEAPPEPKPLVQPGEVIRR